MARSSTFPTKNRRVRPRLHRIAMSLLLKLLKAALLALLLVPASAWAQDPAPARVGFVFSDNNIPGFLSAYRQLLEERPELRERVEVRFLTESPFADVPAEDRKSVV